MFCWSFTSLVHFWPLQFLILAMPMLLLPYSTESRVQDHMVRSCKPISEYKKNIAVLASASDRCKEYIAKNCARMNFSLSSALRNADVSRH